MRPRHSQPKKNVDKPPTNSAFKSDPSRSNQHQQHHDHHRGGHHSHHHDYNNNTTSDDEEDTYETVDLSAPMANSNFVQGGTGGVDFSAAVEVVEQQLAEWKHKEMKGFRAALKKKEAELLKVLALEWKARDGHREEMMTKKSNEYAKLESQLKQAIRDIDIRERKLKSSERDVEQMKLDLQRQYERNLDEARDASRRLQSDVEHSVELQVRKVHDLEVLLSQAKADGLKSKDQYRNLEAEFVDFRQQVATLPVTRLQEDATKSSMQLLELQRQLDACAQSKQRYKSQWTRALTEIATLKKRHQLSAKDTLRREQKELRHMRLQYLAREEQDIADTDKSELNAIKEELEKLRHSATHSSQPSKDLNAMGFRPTAHHQPSRVSGDEATVQRIEDERNSLLRSGVYFADDRIITEMDMRIKSLRGGL